MTNLVLLQNLVYSILLYIRVVHLCTKTKHLTQSFKKGVLQFRCPNTHFRYSAKDICKNVWFSWTLSTFCALIFQFQHHARVRQPSKETPPLVFLHQGKTVFAIGDKFDYLRDVRRCSEIATAPKAIRINAKHVAMSNHSRLVDKSLDILCKTDMFGSKPWTSSDMLMKPESAFINDMLSWDYKFSILNRRSGINIQRASSSSSGTPAKGNLSPN